MAFEPKRQFYILSPESKDAKKSVELLFGLTQSLEPIVIKPKALHSTKRPHPLQGGLILIPSATWPEGALSNLTRIPNLAIISLIKREEGSAEVGLWYGLGATMVFDETVSQAVLMGALARLLEVEVRGLRTQLTRKEGLLFEALRRAGRKGLDRSTLAEQIWDTVIIQEKTIDVHVFNLRRKLNSTRYRIICEAHRFILIEVEPVADEVPDGPADGQADDLTDETRDVSDQIGDVLEAVETTHQKLCLPY